MKINKLILNLALPVMALFAACEPVIEVEPEISAEASVEEVAAEGGDVHVTLQSNVSWTASASSDCGEWVVIEPTSGDASEEDIDVLVTVAPNETEEERQIEIVFADLSETVSSSVSIVQLGKQPDEPEPEIESCTIAEFLAKPVDETVYYQLTGKILDITNTAYSNFYLGDVDNYDENVYIYGLAYKEDIANQRVNLLEKEGIEVGDIITIAATRGEFADVKEGLHSYYISHEKDTRPFIMLDCIETSILGGETFELNIVSNVAWTLTSNVDWLTFEPEKGEGKATVTVNVAAGGEAEGVLTLSAEGVEPQTCVVTRLPEEEPEPEIESCTIAEFLEKPVDETVYYQLKGRISNITNLNYSNFYIEDLDNPESRVYIYGLAYKDDIANQNVKLLLKEGVEVGDIITIAATRGAFADMIEGVHSYYLSHEDIDEPLIKLSVNRIIVNSGDKFSFVVNSKLVSWTLTSDVDWITLEPSSGDASTTVFGTIGEQTEETATLTLSAEGLESQTCIVTREMPLDYTTFAEIKSEGKYAVKDALVMVQYGNRIVLNDGTADFYLYGNTANVSVGDVVTVIGNVVTYDGLLELDRPQMTITGQKEVVRPEPKEYDEAAFAAYASCPVLEYVKTKAVVVNGIAYCGGQELSLVSLFACPANGTVEVCGYAVGFNTVGGYTVILLTELNVLSVDAVINAENLALTEGETLPLGATTNSSAALTYVSQNPAVATVDAEGNVTGVSKGEAVVTISVEANENYTAASKDIIVTVLPAVVVPVEGSLKDIKDIVAKGTSAAPASFSFEMKNAVVTYVNGYNAFIEDETAGLLIFNSGHGYKEGDVLSGVFEGSGYSYYGQAEIATISTKPSVTAGAAPQPTEATLAQVLSDFDAYDSRLIVIKDITITDGLASGDRNGKAAQDGQEIAMYAKINGVALETGAFGDLICIPGINRGNKQLTVWETSHFTPKADDAPVNGVSLNKTSLTLKVGRSATLVATVSPSNAANKNVSWKSSNTAVATVSNGKVTALATGTSVITATSEEGGYTATCDVTVEEASVSDPSAAQGWLVNYEVPGNTAVYSVGNDYSATSSVKETFGSTNAYVYETEEENQRIVTHTFSSGDETLRTYTMLYDKDMKCALWTAFAANSTTFADKNAGRNDSWKYDPALPTDWQPDLSNAYRGGYSRGHQVASSDRQTSTDQNRQTFYYSNMTPQIQSLNGGNWNRNEQEVQGIGQSCSGRDTLYVVTGPVFDDDYKTTTDKSGAVCPIPSGYWKCIMKCSFDTSGNMADAKGAAYYFPSNSTNIECQYKTIDFIESVIGFDLFANVPESLQSAAEATSYSF